MWILAVKSMIIKLQSIGSQRLGIDRYGVRDWEEQLALPRKGHRIDSYV